jgi:hypothetical protein
MNSPYPFLQGSFIPYNMPVYPGARRTTAKADLGWSNVDNWAFHHLSDQGTTRGLMSMALLERLEFLPQGPSGRNVWLICLVTILK